MSLNLTECLTEIQAITKKNLEILDALNNAFYTKKEHLSVSIDNQQYVIPSFVSLENKLNTLTDNFENLVNAPRTGEAAFNFDGNTQLIEVKGFTNVPEKAFTDKTITDISNNAKTFGVRKNAIFKDFLTPTPFIKIDLSEIPDDILNVNVKKVILKNKDLIDAIKTHTTFTNDSVCKPIEYSDLVKKLFAYNADTDYTVYDKIYSMPIRYELGNGSYTIKSIKRNWTDENFYEHYELVLDKLTYTIADDTIEKSILVGDYLVTNNDKVKLLIENIYQSTNTVEVLIENGGFADLCAESDGNADLSTLKFYAIGNIQQNKYLDVPLEEDQFVLIFIAPIQRSSLVQSPWGKGLFFNVFALTDNENTNMSFKEYYDDFVTNVGDKLFGIVSMADADLVNISVDEFKVLTTSKPILNKENIKVSLINKHLNNSDTIQEIYQLYKQKEDFKVELSTVQKQIDEINSILNKVSFEDTTVTRSIYTDQLTDLNAKKNEIVANIANSIQQITLAATDTDTPVENPKYHIRGFFDYEQFLALNKIEKANVIKIDVQYRYKNANKTTGNAETIGDNTGNIFSDWNVMDSFINMRTPKYNYANYKFETPGDTSKENVPSFNQIDIPISQGETVDVKLRVVYNLGFPFISTTSAWSDVVNFEFPVEFKKNITVTEIIEENNSDTTKEAFNAYLNKNGVIEHVSDKLIDQNITYFHQPDHIASGFYTEERRVIPLGDKLQDISNDVIALKDEVYGSSSNNLLVTLSDGESEIVLNPYADNTYILKDFMSSDKIYAKNEDDEIDKVYNPKVETTLTLKIQNNSKTNAIKLFSMFPGNYNDSLTVKTQSKFNNFDFIRDGDGYTYSSSYRDITYTVGSAPSEIGSGSSAIGVPEEEKLERIRIYSATGNICVPLYLDSRIFETYPTEGVESPFIVQSLNQWLYFRVADVYNYTEYYKDFKNGKELNVYIKDKKIVGYHVNYKISETIANSIYPKFFTNNQYGMCVFPHLTDIKDICITEFDAGNYKILYPGESVSVPITVMYTLGNDTANREVSKILGFDLRNSLYTDPITYKFELKAKYANSLANNTRKNKKDRYNPVVVN